MTAFLCLGFQTPGGFPLPLVLPGQCGCGLSPLRAAQQQLYRLHGDNYLAAVLRLLGSEGRFCFYFKIVLNMNSNNE